MLTMQQHTLRFPAALSFKFIGAPLHRKSDSDIGMKTIRIYCLVGVLIMVIKKSNPYSLLHKFQSQGTLLAVGTINRTIKIIKFVVLYLHFGLHR